MISSGFKGVLGGSLLSTFVALGGCSTAFSPPQQRESVARVLDAYAQAMKTGDYSGVRFTPDVTFVGPLTNGAIVGEAQVKDFLRKVSTDVGDVRVKRQIIDGELACG